MVNNTTLQPIAGATVEVWPMSVATDAQGRFTLPAGPNLLNQPGQVTITASAAGFVPTSRQVWIFCGAQLVVDFAPPPPGYGTLTGTVRDEAGQPLPGIFVGGDFGGGATTDAQGRYTLTQVPPNSDGSARTWRVTAVPDEARGLAPRSVSVSVAADQTVTADLTLAPRTTEPANRPPTAVITPASPSVPEGTLIELSAAGSSDPDGDALAYAWDVDGNGFDDGSNPTITLRYTSPRPRVIRLQVTDARGASTITQVTVTVTNVAPVVSVGGNVTVGPDGVFTRTGRFDDPGDGDAFTATVDWGEGAGPVPLVRADRTLTLSHTFSRPGAYQVVVEVCDAAGGCGRGVFVVTVPAPPPTGSPAAPPTAAPPPAGPAPTVPPRVPLPDRLPNVGAAPAGAVWLGTGCLGLGALALVVSRRRPQPRGSRAS